VSEAEIIRQAIEHETGGVPAQPIAADRSAWQELVIFLESRHATVAGHRPYRWKREDIYTERESRWLRDREEE
jgi:hypothetical protein